MKTKFNNINITCINLYRVTFFIFLITACKKQNEWLDVKKNNSDVVLENLSDFQAILNNDAILNSNYPYIGSESSDNLYITDATFNGASQIERNVYIWAQDIYGGQNDIQWTSLYQKIAYANAVLDGLKKINLTPENETEYKSIKGSALFYRAYTFYSLSCFWSKPYMASSASSDLGIPLKLTSEVSENVHRNTIDEVYNQIINDTKKAIDLLPVSQQYKTRPTKTAGLGFLARVYLSMEKYEEAGQQANEALNNYNFLYDFNSIDSTIQYPFPNFLKDNKEVIFYAKTYGARYNTAPRLVVDSNLYRSYSVNDLRRKLFFFTSSGNITFQGTYCGGDVLPFDGIAANELYLIRAEANARSGNKDAALNDINTLLKKRWRSNGSWIPLIASNANDALKKILIERRKELPYTSQLRWTDLRRLNKDPQFSIILKRVIAGQTYFLQPNDPRYIFPIPDIEISMTGIEQNIR